MGARTAESLRTDFSAPLPLGELRAIERAVELRTLDPVGFKWTTIAAVMRVYHGVDRGPTWWRRALRGRVEARPRGRSFGARR